MRISLSVCTAVLGFVYGVPAFARELLICNYIDHSMTQTRPFEITPGTMLKCKDKNLKEIPNSLAGLYSEEYRLVSAISFDATHEGKKTVVLQYYLEK